MQESVRVFVASSSENLDVVDAICRVLQRAESPLIEPAPWHQDTFKLSKTYIESLESELAESEFAVLVLTPNDVASIRKRKHKVPRDNVLFELGLFMGKLGRERCFIVHGDKQPKLPTDLLGVKAAVYKRRKKTKDLEATLEGACEKIVKRVAEFDEEKRGTLPARLAGAWWERIRTGKDDEISFFRVICDRDLSTVRLVDGQHFSSTGKKIGDWQSTYVDCRASQEELYYNWAGRHDPTATGDANRVQGFGYITLSPCSGRYRTGKGGFLDVNPKDMSSARWKTMEIRRATDNEEIRTMTECSEATRGARAGEKLSGW